ncbi:MAG: polyprenyl synthetase family protein [Pseudomonadota bacterium]|jgi:octaprenyl-diphosphate synthase|nr:polyprenyl synthetase family protein [Pseudomonadota bacterium]
MPNIEEQNLTEFLLEVKAKMANITTSENYEINDINQYVLKNSGKFIRSKIIYLYGSEIGVTKHKLIELASAAELIHLSTLIHDDIIDEADLRRDMPTVVKKWGIKKAILYGDFLYTKTFQGLNSFDNTAIADVLINCAEALIEGEFNQLKIKDNCTFSMQDYFDVIEKKTAVLFSGVLKCLGIEAKLSEQEIIELEHLGLAFGRAFQINDDLSDFEDSKITGKAEFKDLSEGKLTLPMIFLLESLEEDKQKEVLKTVENRDFLKLKTTLQNSGCFEKARHERQEAINHCIEYTERFIKLEKLNEIKIFLNSLLIA